MVIIRNYIILQVSVIYCMAANISANGVSRKQVSAIAVDSTPTVVAVGMLVKAGKRLNPAIRLLPPHLRQTVVVLPLPDLSSPAPEFKTAIH